MKTNSILKKLRDIRNTIAEENDYDMKKYFEYLKKREKKWKNPIAKIKPVQQYLGVAEEQAEYK